MRRMGEPLYTAGAVTVEVFITDHAAPVLLLAGGTALALTVDEALHVSAKLTAAGLMADPKLEDLRVPAMELVREIEDNGA